MRTTWENFFRNNVIKTYELAPCSVAPEGCNKGGFADIQSVYNFGHLSFLKQMTIVPDKNE